MTKIYTAEQINAIMFEFAKDTKAKLAPQTIATAIFELPNYNPFTDGERDKLTAIIAPESLSESISKDEGNDLTLGSDNKLLSKPKDTDFLADYILASN